MTRLAILADIHGNLPALEAVAADMQQFSPDHVIVAGDVINWGPFSAEVTDYILDRNWAVIRGNNEFYLLDYQSGREPESWKIFTMPPWLLDQLRGRLHHIIACWPDELQLRFPDAPPVRVCHGLPGDPWNATFPNTPAETVRQQFDGVTETTVIGAHSHIPLDRQVDDWHILNPGSVGLPLDKNAAASYIILDGDASGWRATFRRVPCDYSAVFDAFTHQRFIEQVGPIGRLVIREFETARLQVYPYRLWMAQVHPGELSDTDASIDEFFGIDAEPFMPEHYWMQNLRTP